MLVPILLLLVSALVLACVVMYNHARQVEGTTRARNALFAEELQRAQDLDTALSPTPYSPAAADPATELSWQDRALLLAAQDWDITTIAREVGTTTAEVEMVLAFR
jgi:hypothetical protein